MRWPCGQPLRAQTPCEWQSEPADAASDEGVRSDDQRPERVLPLVHFAASPGHDRQNLRQPGQQRVVLCVQFERYAIVEEWAVRIKLS